VTGSDAKPFILQANNSKTRKNAKDANKTDMFNKAEEARRSKEVIVNQSNPIIIPITVTQDGLLGASNATPMEKSPILSMINKSSNTTLGGAIGGQQSQSKLY
jgi:hypothetical protein